MTYDTERREVIYVAPNATPDVIGKVTAKGAHYAKDADALVDLINKLTMS